MRAMQLTARGARSLDRVDREVPVALPGEVLVRVRACGVCRTDLHIVDGELPPLGRPLVPGHEIIGTVAALGSTTKDFALGTRVGIPWLGWTCGTCEYCKSGRENLCDRAEFTGYQRDGGYAEYVVVDARYCFKLPAAYDDITAAPLLCAGLIGYRALKMAGDARRLGIHTIRHDRNRGYGGNQKTCYAAALEAGADIVVMLHPDYQYTPRLVGAMASMMASMTAWSVRKC